MQNLLYRYKVVQSHKLLFPYVPPPQPARFSSNYAGILQSNCPFSARPCPAWLQIPGPGEIQTEQLDYRRVYGLARNDCQT
jgi:hypothetical protein